jgi:hypothetical protein
MRAIETIIQKYSTQHIAVFFGGMEPAAGRERTSTLGAVKLIAIEFNIDCN